MHSLIFDIGKTNKKAFVFDQDYQELHKVYVQFDEKQDEDDFPCDDLGSIQSWIKETVNTLLKDPNFDIRAINFSSYGASLVHLDVNGKPLTPLYNYLKPLPQEVLDAFHKAHGTAMKIAQETASPALGMLNSGLQLYWIKQTQPAIFKRIHWSLHLPQYLSYLLTGIPLSEFTGIGCHTALWDFSKRDYHTWVHKEGISQKLAPIVPTDTSINRQIMGRKIKVGVGIHDSSSALLPYLRAEQKPFLLISTGTWSIALNPFSQTILTDEELDQDCLNFLRLDGQQVKAARLFLGKEYKTQIDPLLAHFSTPRQAHKEIVFNPTFFQAISTRKEYFYRFEYLSTPWEQPEKTNYAALSSFSEAFHQLMWELTQLQTSKVQLALGDSEIRKIYIDGGFADNDVYVAMLAEKFAKAKIRTTESPLGSALGAAMVISDEPIGKKFLKRNYALKKYKRQVVSQND